jgi:molybdate transport repressor ModE-like protein
MPTLRLSARWQAGATELDARLLPLLRSVAREGSLNRAVSALKLSYRHAWGMLGRMETALGQPLVVMERGRGARLTAAAEKLLEADDRAAAILERELADDLRGLNTGTALLRRRPESPLIVHASHDLALAQLKDLLAKSSPPGLDLHVRGSLECLAGLARGDCEIAGFHVPDAGADRAAFQPYRPWLKGRSLRLVRFVTRTQGLMVARANPMRLLTLADLVERGARFVNRQPESGTRLAFDRLLAAASVRPAQIRGYDVEEFTHAAVAATVASGMADAGFGIEAAARRQGLDFVPLATERYYLAARAATLARRAGQVLLEEMKGAAFRKCLDALPGYRADGTGEVVSARDVLRT